jgi:AraC-like DNA-binding protein
MQSNKSATATNITATDDSQTSRRFRTQSPEQAIHLCEETFHSHKLGLLGRSKGFGWTQRRTQAGPITMADITYDTDVSLHFEGDRDDYYIHIPLRGWLESLDRGQSVISTPALASIFCPDADITVARWPGGTHHLGVRIDQLAVDTALESLLSQPLGSSIAFSATLPVQRGAVQSWVRQLRWMHQELSLPDNALQHPAVLDPLVESIIHGLLLVTDNPYRDALAAPAKPARPTAVHQAMDIIESSPQTSLTTSSLATQCHLSVRALQEGFRRYVGMSPMEYLRMVRLQRAHRDLRSAHPVHSSVTFIAQRWGFSHHGRFSAAYKAMYGETPQQTLRAVR